MNKEYKINKDYIQLLIDNKDKIIHLGENDIRILITYIDVLQQELQRKDNIINELKEWLKENSTRPDLWECDAYYKKILDKIKELENGQSND